MMERRVSNQTMSCTERGEGEAVILLHAFPLDAGMWEPQVDHLSGSYRVITPDLPGFGRSLQSPAQPDMRYYAEGVRALIDRLGLGRVALGGLSMGGYVAFECLRLFPKRISALILANTRADQDSDEMKKTRNETALRVSREGVGVLVELQMERLLSRATIENKPEVVEKVRGMILKNTPDGVVAALGALRDRRDSTPLLEEIDIPTLVIGGSEDEISSPEVMGAMSRKIRDSRHVVLSGAGHLSNLEASEEFNAAMREFLTGAKV